MHKHTTPKNAGFVSLLTLILTLCILVYALLNEQRTNKAAQRDTEYYSVVLSDYLWQLDSESAQRYVDLIAKKGDFREICIKHPDDSPFVQYTHAADSSQPSHALRSINAIRDIHSKCDILHHDKVIGSLSIHSENTNIYSYLILTGVAALAILTFALVRSSKQKKLIYQKVQHDLNQNEEMLHSVVASAPVITFTLSPKAKFTHCEGHPLEKITKKRVVGNSLKDFTNELPITLEDFKKSLGGKSFRAIRTTKERTFETWYSPLYSEEKKINGVQGVSTDITTAIQAIDSIDNLQESQRLSTQIAQATQSALLPHSAPQLEGYDIGIFTQQSPFIGGDYLCFQHSKKAEKLSLTLAEVSGHGVNTALLTHLFDHLIHQQYQDHGDKLVKLFYSLNSSIHQQFPEGGFASTLHAEVDTNSHQLSFIKASREPAILFSKSEPPKIFDKGGPALGLFPSNLLDSASYKINTQNLESGDTLLLYSDGITHIDNYKGEPLERSEIVEHVSQQLSESSQSIAESLATFAKNRANPDTNFDDITIVVLKKL